MQYLRYLKNECYIFQSKQNQRLQALYFREIMALHNRKSDVASKLCQVLVRILLLKKGLDHISA